MCSDRTPKLNMKPPYYYILSIVRSVVSTVGWWLWKWIARNTTRLICAHASDGEYWAYTSVVDIQVLCFKVWYRRTQELLENSTNLFPLDENSLIGLLEGVTVVPALYGFSCELVCTPLLGQGRVPFSVDWHWTILPLHEDTSVFSVLTEYSYTYFTYMLLLSHSNQLKYLNSYRVKYLILISHRSSDSYKIVSKSSCKYFEHRFKQAV